PLINSFPGATFALVAVSIFLASCVSEIPRSLRVRDPYSLSRTTEDVAHLCLSRLYGSLASLGMLASLKRCRPLLHVCVEAFLGVFAGEQALLQFALHGKGGLERNLQPVCTLRLMLPTAFAALLGGVNWRAYSITFSMKPSRSKMSLMMPSSFASSKVKVLPVTISSMALLLPTIRLRRCVPPVPGRTPRLISGSPILPASRRAMRMSAAMAISSPPPTQCPLIAAITSFGVCSS